MIESGIFDEVNFVYGRFNLKLASQHIQSGGDNQKKGICEGLVFSSKRPMKTSENK